jgi:hypothetical protein
MGENSIIFSFKSMRHSFVELWQSWVLFGGWLRGGVWMLSNRWDVAAEAGQGTD